MSDMSINHAAGGYRFTRNPGPLTTWLRLCLWASLGSALLMILSNLLQLELLTGEYFTVDQASANDNRQMYVAVLFLGTSLVTGTLFLRWIYVANVNCRGFGTDGMEFTPGWAVGYYFVPFLGLYKPYYAMKEIWQVSEGPENWSYRGIPRFIMWWWGLFLITPMLLRISSQMTVGMETTDALVTSTVSAIFADLCYLALCFLAIKLVSMIYANQRLLVSAVSARRSEKIPG